MKTRIKNLFVLLVSLTGIHQTAAKAATVFPIATNHTVVQFGWNIAFGSTNYLVSYVSGTNKVVQLISTNGALLGSPVIAGTNVSFVASGLLAFGATNYLVVWSDDAISGAVDMFGQFISQGGAKVGASFKLLSTSDYNNNGYGYQTVEALATDGTNFLVGWQDGNSGNFFGQLVTPSGTLAGQEFLISSGDSGNPNTGGADSIAIAFGGTNYLAVWQSQDGGSNYQTYGELISRTGIAGSPFQINQTASVDGFNPINVAFDGTNYLAAWNWDAGSVSGAPEDWEIFGRLVSQTGTFPGNELQLVTDPDSQVLPELAFDGANYLMAWGAGSFNHKAANPTVHFQFFSRSGSPASSEFTVFNAQGTSSPLLAGLVFDGTRFVAVATLGTISTGASGSVDGFPSAEVFGAFIPVTVPLGVTTTSLPNGTNGVNYNQTLTATGGQTPYTWTNVSGALLSGLTLATNGLISGTPTTNGTFNFTVKVTDMRAATAATNLSITISTLDAVLTVTTNGIGTITPNLNGQMLQVGATYSMKAAPGSGYAFTNWTGGVSLPLTVLTNGPTLQFVMQPNLTLQANFVDTNRPAFTLTNELLTNGSFVVSGTNKGVAALFGRIDAGAWSASSVNVNNRTWTWTTPATNMIPGTNSLQFYAQSASGIFSPTNSTNYFLAVPARLTVLTNGLGSLSPDYSGQLLFLGRNYGITATPAKGFAFTNWSGGTNVPLSFLTNHAAVQFMMLSNLMLEANFVETSRPTLTISVPANGQHLSNALASVSGTAADNWKVSGVWCQINSNGWALASSTNGWTNWTTVLKLAAGTNTIRGYAEDLGGNVSLTNSVSVLSSNLFKLLLGFTNGPPVSGNGWEFNLVCSTGLVGHIEYSTNLLNWSVLTNFTGSNGIISFRDPGATNSIKRFYRAVIP